MPGADSARVSSELVARAAEELRRGRLVLVADDEGRENEGDLIGAAEHMTPEAMAFLVRHTSGLVCVGMDGARLDELRLPPMVGDADDPRGTAFAVSVDIRTGVSTGISAADRARTARGLASPLVGAGQFTRPGHVFPLRARPGGVLERAGHTEAAVDLCRIAGLLPAGALAEVTNSDGTMARRPDLERMAREHGLVLLTVADIVRHRMVSECLVSRTGAAKLPTRHGEFTAVTYLSAVDGREHLALVRGEPHGQDDVLVRVHSECLTGDVFGSRRCDCGQQLDLAMAAIGEAGTGVVVYLRGHEGRGIGLTRKLQAYQLQDTGLDTVEANLELGLPVDSREYGAGAQILRDLGVASIRLMTNNPAKHRGLESYGVRVTGRVGVRSRPNEHNAAYLRTKAERLGHLLGEPAGDNDHDEAQASLSGKRRAS
ncbi:bifunctional 3,4-dihydroxy-2-butanone-4-phosphate synthase/GTP cyclohydrolase II [Amycolatopsis thermoflava]|uniref:bifunctional 3,4-dihydroxy-2-butanone-4-phosphate synthase/GTP cyclohydrolase II n=1 Tax=Amycolatopsis thermoflava TaxID=84480 RepID=UPI0037F23F5F